MQETKKRLRFNPWVRSPGGGHSNPLQYSCLENPTDRGAWWATVHKVAKCQTRLSDLAYTHAHEDYSLEDSLSGNWGNAPEKHRFGSSVLSEQRTSNTSRTHSFRVSRKNTSGDFPGGLVAKTLLSMQGAQVQSLVRELDPKAAAKTQHSQ